jgi:hypothetical protein
MAFTAGEIASTAASALDFYIKGQPFDQKIQNKPLLAYMESNGKTFPGGKGDISLPVKGDYGAAGVNDGVAGYTHNDTVNFYTPSNVKRAAFAWREHHIGITLTFTELKIDGISVTDENGDGSETRNHSQREKTALVNIFENKLDDMAERYAVTMNNLLWGDGVADAKALAGIRHIIREDPSVGVVGGIDAATTSWWRNRARTTAFGAKVTGTPALAAWGGDKITASAANGGALLTVLQGEFRQLRRYGGSPKKALCGSDFLAAMEMEMRANGTYSMNGFRGPQDGAMGTMKFDGIEFQYDPTLDDLNKNKFCYIWDTSHIYLYKMDGEWKKQFTPNRPANQFVMYRSLVSTGQVAVQQRNASGVYEIA